jgi:copper chaperone CopZ
METIDLAVSGMTCSACVKHVEKAINSIAGVQRVIVNLDAGTAKVEGDFSKGISPILAALEKSGYPAQVRTAAPGNTKSGSCKNSSSCCCN